MGSADFYIVQLQTVSPPSHWEVPRRADDRTQIETTHITATARGPSRRQPTIERGAGTESITASAADEAVYRSQA